MSKPPLSAQAWILRDFPDADPPALLKYCENVAEAVNIEEHQRAIWVWAQRPAEARVLLHLVILSVGALLHVPLLLLADLNVFVVYHLLYLVLVVWLAGRFVLQESRYRRWRRDYLRSLARVIEPQASRPGA
jgi:hypothetical protein